MSKKVYKGSLTLDWYNKQKSIILRGEKDPKGKDDIPAPKINWVNKDQALFYEINEEEGKGVKPYWVDRSDIRVKETRPLIFQKAYKTVPINNDLMGQTKDYRLVESDKDDPSIENILIRGDNLLALNTLKKMFDQKPEDEKVKCIYIDPPFNIQRALEHYDDNLKHSEWLSLMRDRLNILKSILSFYGVIVVHLDDREVFYCKIILDEIFGSENFFNSIALKSSTPSGKKTTHRESKIIKQKDWLLIYTKSEKIKINPQYVKRKKWDTHFSKILDMETFEYYDLVDTLIDNNVLPKGASSYDIDINNEKFKEFYMANSNRIFQTQPSISAEGREISLKNKDKIVKYCNDPPQFALNGRRLVFLDQSISVLDSGEKDISILLCDFWDDIDFQNTQNEGGVSFPSGKKPESLINRIIKLFSEQNDYILDCFAGAGTTLAVATKLKRKWIGVEIGKHSDTHIITRLKNVLTGIDQNGISKKVNWKGGGSFKYYHLGPSIINIGQNGKGEFNWELGRIFIEESLLNSYDYIIDNTIKLPKQGLFDNEIKPKVGFLKLGTKIMSAICSLNEPNGNREMMNIEEILTLYNAIKEQHKSEIIKIFTNRGIEMALDSKPEDLEIIKVPYAIFAELEK